MPQRDEVEGSIIQEIQIVYNVSKQYAMVETTNAIHLKTTPNANKALRANPRSSDGLKDQAARDTIPLFPSLSIVPLFNLNVLSISLLGRPC
jgi:hypothetical protein